jgi:hypothetical protein
VAALVCRILPLVPLALAAGVAGLARTRDGRRPGRAAAAGGLTLAGAWALAGAVTAVLLLVPRAAPRPVLPRDTVLSLRTGQCATTARNGVSGVHAVPCGQPHQVEIYGRFRLAGAGWPGIAAVRQRARQGCERRLAGYLDPGMAGGSLLAAYAYPGRVAWLAGERSVVCELRARQGTLTGSVRGPGRAAPPGHRRGQRGAAAAA